MFSEIDKTIFPDSCEVIQMSSQHFVYPIFKNASSSLTESVVEKGWNIISNEDIGSIQQPITIFLRNPKERFISGVNTYIQHLQSNNLDTDTILYFVDQYLFLNRHYCPQFFWLINLARYTNTQLHFQDYRDVSNLTHRKSKAGITDATPELLDKINKFDWKRLELYFFLDQMLMDLIGNTTTFADVLVNLKTTQPELYDLVFANTIEISNVLPKA